MAVITIKFFCLILSSQVNLLFLPV